MIAGFKLRKLAVVGADRKTALVNFRDGLNVISGASDTGKSYIFECIRFMLGGSEVPKDIEESKGYSSVLLEIESIKGNFHSIRRSLLGGDFTVFPSKIDEIKETQGKSYRANKKIGSGETISTFFLSLCSLDGKQVRTNGDNKKSDLTFTDVRRLIAIDEEEIIKKESPVLTGQFTLVTREISVFNLITTGVDASSLITVPSKLQEAQVLARQETIDEFIKKLESRLGPNSLANDASEDRLDDAIQEASSRVTSAGQLINEQTEIRQSTWDQDQECKSRVIAIDELLIRFQLLSQYYQADLKRLRFLAEGQQLFTQLNAISCPQCGRTMPDSHDGCEEQLAQSNILMSCEAELAKIEAQLNDLSRSIADLKSERNKLILKIKQIGEQYASADQLIKNSLSQRLISEQKVLGELLRERDGILERDVLRRQLEELLIARNALGKTADARKGKEESKGKKSPVSVPAVNEFCTHVSNRLKKWEFPESSTVTFDSSTLDLIIGNKPRSNFGKGNRAVVYSAFVIGLLDYCFTSNRPHPSFVILDSPLTTHRDIDSGDSEEISESVEAAFFSNLGKDSKSAQIIILENKEPHTDIKSVINYVYFSGSEKHGRKGFFQ